MYHFLKIRFDIAHEKVLGLLLNAVIQTGARTATTNVVIYEDFRIQLKKIEWVMPYVMVSNAYKIRLLNYIEKNRPISMSFRSWELYEYPILPQSPKHVWTVKTSNQLEKPRFIILAFQTNRKNLKTANASRFDHCNLSNVKLFLNSQYYPYGNLNLDINNQELGKLMA